MEKEDIKRIQNGNDYTDSHPAFGMIEIARVMSGGKISLCGTRSTQHGSFVRIAIRHADRTHSLYQDRWHGHSKPIAEVFLSSTQFADLLTRMNTGGVPCTIRAIEGKSIPTIPLEDNNELGRILEKLQKTIERDLEERGLSELEKTASDILNSKGAMRAADKQRLKDAIARVVRVVRDHLPFAATQYSEALEVASSEAQQNAVETLNLAIKNAGIKALQDAPPSEQQIIKLLTGEE